MEINRDNNKIDRVNFKLRYWIKDEVLAKKIHMFFDDNLIIHEFYKPSKRRDEFVMLIDLEQNPFDFSKIKLLHNELELELENCFGFWFDITSDFQMGGFTVPLQITNYLKDLGGQLDFSYIS